MSGIFAHINTDNIFTGRLMELTSSYVIPSHDLWDQMRQLSNQDVWESYNTIIDEADFEFKTLDNNALKQAHKKENPKRTRLSRKPECSKGDNQRKKHN